ncbi:MAG: dipicolinate synthase subunit B [Clostridia bacterium]|nr:dipicolinate synthase subunit B [Clostridia bacterium]
MDLSGIRVGFALTGSFCTLSAVVPEIKNLKDKGAVITPIMSENVFSTDTRFGTAESFTSEIEEISENKILKTIPDVEPLGPRALLDILIIAPCTGNTLGKLASGISDTSVTMAAKAHMRNSRPVLIAVSTNDGLASSAKNIGFLLNYKNIFFVPFGQDDYLKKPNSLVADMQQIPQACEFALHRRQIQPVLI